MKAENNHRYWKKILANNNNLLVRTMIAAKPEN